MPIFVYSYYYELEAKFENWHKVEIIFPYSKKCAVCTQRKCYIEKLDEKNHCFVFFWGLAAYCLLGSHFSVLISVLHVS